MALTVGVNSWITITEADDYLAGSIVAEDWFALVPTGVKGTATKENILITSFNEITASPLVDVSADSIDSRVKAAQAEMAIFVLKYYTEVYGRRASITSGLSSFDYSERAEDFNSRDGGGQPSLPGNVLGLLNEYGQSNTFAEMKV